MKYENLAEMFESQCREIGRKKLYFFYDKRLRLKSALSGIELCNQSHAIASSIASLSMGKSFNISGEVVFLSFTSVSNFIVTFWAVVLSGGIPAPVSTKMAKNEERLKKAIADSCAVLLISDSGPSLSGGDTRSVRFHDLCQCQSVVVGNINSEFNVNEFAILQHSSGSTSDPKPIALSNRNVLHNLERIAEGFAISEDDVGASWLPHYHDMGLIGHILVPLYCGIENHFISPVDFSIRPISWLRLISKTGATISGAPNFGYQHCHEAIIKNSNEIHNLNLSKWRVAYSGAECISPKTLNLFSSSVSATGFSADNFYPCYGLAESTLMVSCRRGVRVESSDASKNKKYVSVGAINHHEVTIKKEDESVCAEREIGHIYIHSPSVARLSDQSAVNTGDMGFVSEGELYVVGRQINVAKYHGEKIYLEEVESLLDERLSKYGVRRCLLIQGGSRYEQYTVLIESSTRWPVKVCQKVSTDITYVMSAYFGDSAFRTKSVGKREIITTSSGKPDREQNRKSLM